MTVPADRWIDLATLGVRRARVRSHEFDDAVGAALVAFAESPPADPALAVHVATCRAIDWLRSQNGNPRTVSGRLRATTMLASDTGAAWDAAGADDPRLALVDALDELERAELTDDELEAIVAHVSGVSAIELAAARGGTAEASRQQLRRARGKLRSPSRSPED